MTFKCNSLFNIKILSSVAIAMSLLACSGHNEPPYAQLAGQVGGVGNADSKLSHYAASRFLEQASMGPSPATLAQVRSQGIENWIASQQALSPSLIRTPDAIINYNLQDRVASSRANAHFDRQIFNLFVSGQDQLKIRTSWVLSNFLVVSNRKVQVYGTSEYFNLLQNHAFGQYADLLKAISRNPAMGFYLDNGQNRRGSLNENYGRELMQLFSVGLVQLNMDGTAKRDANGKVLETYSQQDVIEATRALTGWEYADPHEKRSESNGFNYGKPMTATWADGHDTGAKTVLGVSIPAGQNAEKDLDSLVDILVNHPNTAPFVSLRLIQGLTTSDPSPAYLSRVANVFAKTRGNLGQVVKAILLDPEARAGDDPRKTAKGFGRIKEPLLLHVSVLRGLGCRTAVSASWDPTQTWTSHTQQPLNAYSVFNFYPPNHRTPGTKVLAPEQKTLNATEFSHRLGDASYNMSRTSALSEAGCDVQLFTDAAERSREHLAALLGERFFRGAMPAAVAQGLIEAHRDYWTDNNPMRLTGAMLEMAMLTPSFGVSK